MEVKESVWVVLEAILIITAVLVGNMQDFGRGHFGGGREELGRDDCLGGRRGDLVVEEMEEQRIDKIGEPATTA